LHDDDLPGYAPGTLDLKEREQETGRWLVVDTKQGFGFYKRIIEAEKAKHLGSWFLESKRGEGVADLLSHLVDAPLANILILAGLAFLAIGILGKISGKIEPSAAGRIMSGLLGAVLLIYGIHAHSAADVARPHPDHSPERPTPQGHTGIQLDACLAGYVWREANPSDHVCVTPQVREQTAFDNGQAASRRAPSGGAYGPDTCVQGYVWRDAFSGDHVCVTVATRTQAARDNRLAPTRVATSR